MIKLIFEDHLNVCGSRHVVRDGGEHSGDHQHGSKVDGDDVAEPLAVAEESREIGDNDDQRGGDVDGHDGTEDVPLQNKLEVTIQKSCHSSAATTEQHFINDY